MGRIASFKMIILPKLIYLFRTVVLPIPNALFSSIQRQITRFAWDNKPPRFAHHILMKHHNKGGVGLPNICTYYYAAILDQMYYWWHPSPNKTWSDMESLHPTLNKLLDILLLIIECSSLPVEPLPPAVRSFTVGLEKTYP